MFKLSVHNHIAEDNHSRETYGVTVAITITVAALLCLAFLLLQNMYNATRPIIKTIPPITDPTADPVDLKYNNNMKIHF